MEAPDQIDVELLAPSGVNPVIKRMIRRYFVLFCFLSN
jgi:hypothetical protein